MISLCNKFKEMVKDEEKGTQEYEDLQFEMTKALGSKAFGKMYKEHIDTLDLIANDEDRHGLEIKQIMKDLTW